jgi:hypothetical protein
MPSPLGLRKILKSQLKRAIDRLSGEHSEAAPADRKDYSRPGQPNEEAEVVMARLNRPNKA